MMKKAFLTGLAILLPTVLTFLILSFLVNLITRPFLALLLAIFHYYGVNENSVFVHHSLLVLFSKLVILVSLFLIIIGIGYIGELFLVRWIRRLGDYLVHRIPFVNRIYKTTQEIVNNIFMPKSASARFSNVVLVPFPHKNTYSIGLVTNSSGQDENDPQYREKISVFVPGTPNPAMGFMLLFSEDQLIKLDISVDEALKFCVSCGVIAPKSMENTL